jgi:hypothetical protein
MTKPIGRGPVHTPKSQPSIKPLRVAQAKPKPKQTNPSILKTKRPTPQQYVNKLFSAQSPQLRKLAVRKLFDLNAEKELSKALIDSIKKNRTDVFMAILTELTPVGKEWYRPMEAKLINKTAKYLQSISGKVRGKEQYVLHLAARWALKRISFFLKHPLRNSTDMAIRAALQPIKQLKTGLSKVARNIYMLNLARSHTGAAITNTVTVLSLQLKNKGFNPTAFSEVLNTYLLLYFASSAKNTRNRMLANLVALAQLHLGKGNKVIHNASFIKEAAAHHNDPALRKSLYTLQPYILKKAEAYAFLKARMETDNNKAAALTAALSLYSVDPIKSLSDMVSYALSPNCFTRSVLALVLQNNFKTLGFRKGSVAGKLFDRIRQQAMNGKGKTQTAAVSLLGGMNLSQSRALLKKLAINKDTAISEAALRAYIRNIGVKNKNYSFRLLSILMPQGYHNPSVPYISNIRSKLTSFDKLKLPSGLSKRVKKSIDWNKDGSVRGSYERYQLWKRVGWLQTQINRYEKNSLYTNDATMKKSVALLKRELKKLIPLYKHLPQVNYAGQTVLVNGTKFKIKSEIGKISSKRLFGIGEAISSMPRLLRRNILAGIHQNTIEFVVKKSLARPNDGARHIVMSRRRMILSKPQFKYRIEINAHRFKIDSFGRFVRTIKHELGHSLDTHLGYEEVKAMKCTVRSAIPIISIFKFTTSCARINSIVQKYIKLSNFNDFKKSWTSRLRKAGLNKRVISQFENTRYGVNESAYAKPAADARKHFANTYGSTSASEDFATMWASYLTLPSPWSREHKWSTRSDVKRVSPKHWNLFRIHDTKP